LKRRSTATTATLRHDEMSDSEHEMDAHDDRSETSHSFQTIFQPRFNKDNQEEETSLASPLSFHKPFQSKCYKSQSRKINNDCRMPGLASFCHGRMPGLASFCHGSFANGSGVTGSSVTSGASAMFLDFTDSVSTLECSAKNGFDEMMTSQHHKSISILPIKALAE
jgi:hypothetical protein